MMAMFVLGGYKSASLLFLHYYFAENFVQFVVFVLYWLHFENRNSGAKGTETARLFVCAQNAIQYSQQI